MRGDEVATDTWASSDLDHADSLCLLVETLDATVHVAYDGPSALQIAAAFKPDVVFLDLMMPEMDGYETATRLRQLPGGRDLLLVALTGFGQAKHRRSTLEAGFDEHLRKPVDFTVLQELIRPRRVQAGSPERRKRDRF